MTEQRDSKWCIGCWAKLDSNQPICQKCSRSFSATDPSTYYEQAIGYGSMIDLHILYLSLVLGIIASFLPWPLIAAIALFLVPQPMLVVQALTRYLSRPEEQKSNRAYILINEGFVGLFALAVFAFKHVYVWITQI